MKWISKKKKEPNSYHIGMDLKKTWLDIDKAVSKSRMAQYQLSSFVPSHFTFYKNLVIFLGVPLMGESFSNENTLIYVDIENGVWENMDIDKKVLSGRKISNDGLEAQSYSTFHWNLLLDPQAALSTSTLGYSRDEELLRERKRLISHGITSYDFDHETGRLLFRSGSDIYTVDVAPIAAGTAKYAIPRVVSHNICSNKMDSKICPSNANIISFIENGDIWVSNIVNGIVMQLTFVRNSSTARDDAVSAGEPSYVTQEEFGRFTGYWWEPRKQQEMEGSLEVHKILYELVDQRMVDELHISTTPDSNFTNHVETYRYPKAGSTNAKSSLRLVEFCVKSSTNEFLEGSIVECELRVDLQEMFPWVEYIVRCGWMPDGKHIWMKVLNRAQNRLALLRIPCSAFRPLTMNSDVGTTDSCRHHKIDLLLEEHSDYWINVSDVMHFIPNPRSDCISFLWLSEQTQYQHLYLVNVTTESGDGYFGVNNQDIDNQMMQQHEQQQSPTPPPPKQLQQQQFKECVVRCYHILEKKQLTSGPWEVNSEKVWVDIRNELIYFLANKDTALENHLYCISLRTPIVTHRLTKCGFNHDVTLNKDCSHAVVVSSSIDSLAQVNLCRVLQNPVHHIERMSLNGMGWLEAPRELPKDYIAPEIFSYTNNQGNEIFGMLFKPLKCVPGEKYPTLLYVYGGPGVQLVSNSQQSVRRVNLFSLATLGYAIVIIDTMGSSHRGIKFEAAIQNKMGTVEIEQQIEGLRHIATKSGVIDMNKIVIHGWSYGGYLALMGLCQRPDIFKVAVAGAPVTCWELYDTAYTERYMNLPSNNKDAYKRGSVLNYAKQFPSEPNRLLIVHGLVDENVHFSHTSALVSELVKAGKPYQLQVYPTERHGIRSSTATRHYEVYVMWFIQQYLSTIT